jgi:hypothetical protein
MDFGMENPLFEMQMELENVQSVIKFTKRYG